MTGNILGCLISGIRKQIFDEEIMLQISRNRVAVIIIKKIRGTVDLWFLSAVDLWFY